MAEIFEDRWFPLFLREDVLDTSDDWGLFYPINHNVSMTAGRWPTTDPAATDDWSSKTDANAVDRSPDAVSQNGNVVGFAGGMLYTPSTASQSSPSQGCTPESIGSGENEEQPFETSAVARLNMYASSAASSSSADDMHPSRLMTDVATTMATHHHSGFPTTSSEDVHGTTYSAAPADPLWTGNLVQHTGDWIDSSANLEGLAPDDAYELHHQVGMGSNIYHNQDMHFPNVNPQQSWSNQLPAVYSHALQASAIATPDFHHVNFQHPPQFVPPGNHPNFSYLDAARVSIEQPLPAEPLLLRAPPATTGSSRMPQSRSPRSVQNRPVGPAPLRHSTSGRSPSSSSHNSGGGTKRNRGGRRTNSKLSPRAKLETANMRKIRACWGCKIRRDKCPDNGDPCARCKGALQRAAYGLPCPLACRRQLLPEFTAVFLPETMTRFHTKAVLEAYSKEHVLKWADSWRIISLESGYGPPLSIRACEYIPKDFKSQHLLQYRQVESMGIIVPVSYYSVPLGLTNLEATDDVNFKEHMQTLLEPNYLSTLPGAFYQSNAWPEHFCGRLLAMLCRLWEETADQKLKQALKPILLMIIVTYIMSHSLTIPRSDTESVLQSIKHSTVRNWEQSHYSSRILNRQLKLHFAEIRNNMCLRILQQLQTCLQASNKESSWLPSFCVLLGTAICFEEIENTIFLQAQEAHEEKGEDREAVEQRAQSTCKRMDGSFDFLLDLFRVKYRDPKWEMGSFGQYTPLLQRHDQASHQFLRNLHALVVENRELLHTRQSCSLDLDQSHVTSRLTARVLLPFLILQGA